MAKRSAALLGRLRTWTGLLAAAVFNLAPLGLKARSLACPGFNCHGCPWSTMACPIGATAYGSAMRTFPAVAVGTVAAVGLCLGRLVCGFACPFGWLQDLLHRVPLPKFRLPRATRLLKYAALALLVVALPLVMGFDVSGYLKVGKPALVPGATGSLQVTPTVTNLGTEPVRGFELAPVYRRGGGGEEVVSRETVQRYPDLTVAPGQSLALPPFVIPNRLDEGDLVIESPESVPDLRSRYDLYYCRVCPKGTLTATLPAIVFGGGGNIYGGLGRSWPRLGILALLLALMLFVSRPFCQALCPLGAAYGLASRLAVVRVVIDRPACIECGACSRICPVNLDVPREVGGPECIACGDCIGICPQSAVRRRIGL